MKEKFKLIPIVQGDYYASNDPDEVISTTVGSCVAACLFDPALGIGGMNHFLLPDAHNDGPLGGAKRYGVHLMELLINSLLSRGACRTRLQAKAFGGACITQGLTRAGSMNATFVEEFLRLEGIPLIGGSLRGTKARRVQFWPASGRARQMFCNPADALVPAREAQPILKPGEVELF